MKKAPPEGETFLKAPGQLPSLPEGCPVNTIGVAGLIIFLNKELGCNPKTQ
jgi:hypothetical protein